MTELGMEHILIVAIVACVLYYFMGRCRCNGNGFSIGAQCALSDEASTNFDNDISSATEVLNNMSGRCSAINDLPGNVLKGRLCTGNTSNPQYSDIDFCQWSSDTPGVRGTYNCSIADGINTVDDLRLLKRESKERCTAINALPSNVLRGRICEGNSDEPQYSDLDFCNWTPPTPPTSPPTSPPNSPPTFLPP